MVLVEQRRHVKSKPTLTLRNTLANPTVSNAEHAPVPVGILGPVEFSRCPCGFTLARYNGRLFWIRAKPGIRELQNPDELALSLRTRCWYHRRKDKPTGKAPMSVASSNSCAVSRR